MQFWLSDQPRLYALIALCALLWTLEFIVPLYRYGRQRLPHVLPNVLPALFSVLTNPALSAGTAGLAAFAERHRFGLFHLLGFSPLLTLIFGVAALDFFGYRAHRLLHRSWLGWQFHRVHHSEAAGDVTTAFRSRIQKEADTNYSNIFSFWDRLCGTHTPRIDFGGLRYGLDGFDDPDRQSLRGLLTMPFVKF